MKKIVYLASPFFNQAQIGRIALVEGILDDMGISYFSPRKECICPPDASDEVRDRVFNDNLRHIEECEFVIAITDEKDMGTVWEAGYAYGANKPIIYCAFTLGDAPFNLMLALSGVKTVKTFKELDNVLGSYVNTGSVIGSSFDGSIE